MNHISFILSFGLLINIASAQVEPSSVVHQLTIDSQKVFVFVEEMPEYPGGHNVMMDYLRKNIMYPKECVENGVMGKVYVRFVVNEDGSINHIECIKSSGNRLLDEEAMRVVQNMPAWKPGKQQGKNVKVQFTLPINFYLK